MFGLNEKHVWSGPDRIDAGPTCRIVPAPPPNASGRTEAEGQHQQYPLYRLALRKAVQIYKEHKGNMGPERMVLQTGIGTKPSESSIRLPARVSLCICCLGRGWQLQCSLPINMLVCLPYLRHSVRFVIALFEPNITSGRTEVKDGVLKDYKETVDFLRKHFEEFLKDGSLVVYLPKRALFHSSVCKNQSHKMAVMTPWGQGGSSSDGFQEAARFDLVEDHCNKKGCTRITPASMDPTTGARNQRRHLLVNLDADNIMKANWLNYMMAELKARDFLESHQIWGLRANGEDSGVTGRVGMPEEVWLDLQGYDESFHPTGFQDMDIVKRIQHVNKQGLFWSRTSEGGWSVPNASDPIEAKGFAKTRFAGNPLKWTKQNEQNMSMGKEALKKNKWWRNSDEHPKSAAGMWGVINNLGNEDDRGFFPRRLVGIGREGGTSDHRQPFVRQHSQSSAPPPPPSTPADQLPAPPPPKVKPPPLPHVNLRVITCGIINLEQVIKNVLGQQRLPRELLNDLHVLRKCAREHKPVDEDMLYRCLSVVPGLFSSSKKTAMFLDVRNAHDPENTPLRSHLGRHPVILRSASRLAVVHEALRSVQRAIYASSAAETASSTDFMVVIFCKGGNHRSVAVSELLWYASQARGLTTFSRCEQIHMTEMGGFWVRPNRCGPCDLCCHHGLDDALQRLKQEAVQNAALVWHDRL